MLDFNATVKNPEDLIFSLDIGTRTVIGIVGIYEDEKFKVLESCIKEHNKRNMYDGQIHDIEGVTKIVKEVKEELEEKLELPLKKVSIAAAGRALKTSRIRIDKEIDKTVEISNNMIEALELEAAQKSQELIDEEKSKNDLKYYCIGYSVVNYYLDDSFIENLEGHKGEKIGVDLLATFLPQVVIDSLYVVVNRAGLEVSNITLEPIAAINVAIKENLRLLNLALVDIGAGTSDIAITKDGTIMAYAMTATAGDELTESLARAYLLDFDSSEKLKINLNKENTHEFSDIVGVKYKLTTEEIISNIENEIDKLAKEISEKIIEYNGKAPSAVFLVGGSSQIPTLNEHIANCLGLPIERVAIRDISFIENVEGIEDELKGPDIVTPIGIAMEGVNSKYKNFIQIYINGEEIRVFNTENIKVSDVLILIGYNPRKLIPQRGEDFIYYVNGKKKLIKGELGKPAEIYVNGTFANLNTELKDRDFIDLRDSTKGDKKILYLYDCIPKSKVIVLNNEEVNLIRELRINGLKTEGNVIIKEGDRVDYFEIKTVYELVEYMNMNIHDLKIYRNSKEVDLYTELKNGDMLTIGTQNGTSNIKDSQREICLSINGKERIFQYKKKEFVFVDIFNYIDFDLSKPRGKLVLKLNERDAEYLERLKDGDMIEVYWEN